MPLLQEILDVVQDVVAQKLIIHLTGPYTVEGLTPHFILFFTFGSNIAVVFGTARSKFNDVVTIPHLIFKVPEVIAKKRIGKTRTMDVDNTVRITIHYTFF